MPSTKSEKPNALEAKTASTKQGQQEEDDTSQGSLEIGACCLCHCALDYSDRAAFLEADRQEDYNDDSDEEEYFFRRNDPYLPLDFHDKHNALVYCDSCNRMYHQKCHFVPITVLPRGDWHCLLCQSLQTKKKDSKKQQNDEKAQAFLSQQLFQSPPIPQVRTLEQQWEYTSRSLKAHLYKTELRQRLYKTLQSQLANIRLAEMALETLTSTQKNRSHFTHTSQEVAQLLVKLYGARLKLREYLSNLRDIILSNNIQWNRLQEWAANCNNADFVKRVLFPFGPEHARRTDPRTPEMQLNKETTAATIPTEIVVSNDSKKPSKHHHHHHHDHEKAQKQKDDDDSGISLDDLCCCVCHTSESTDENDLILCDGAGCYRAYHMKCIRPEVTPADLENEDDDWFCPICQTLADHMLLIQTEYMGDDWEQRRYVLHWEGKETTGSLKSWDYVDEVFPEAPRDYETACLLRDGKRTPATDALLKRVLDLEELPEASDDDNVEVDGHWDLYSYQEERRKMKEEMEEEESVASSQATLMEMSSVELEIGKDELAALSEASDSEEESSSDNDDDDESEDGVRRSRRLRKRMTTSDNSDTDIGRLDEANIVEGKRGRKPVDYRLLNEAIFGGLSDGEVAKIDDADDFQVKTRKRDSSESSDSDSSDSSDSDSDRDDSNDDESQSDDMESSKRSSSRKAGTSDDDEEEENNEESSSKPVAKRSKSTKARKANTKCKSKASAEEEKLKSKPVAKSSGPKKASKAIMKRKSKSTEEKEDESERSVLEAVAERSKQLKSAKAGNPSNNRKLKARSSDGDEDNSDSKPVANASKGVKTKTRKTSSKCKRKAGSADDDGDGSEEATRKAVARGSKEAKKAPSATSNKRNRNKDPSDVEKEEVSSKPVAKVSKEPKTKKASDQSKKRNLSARATAEDKGESEAATSRRISKGNKASPTMKAKSSSNKRKRKSDSVDEDVALAVAEDSEAKKGNKSKEPPPKKRKQEDDSDASGQGEVRHAKTARVRQNGRKAKASKKPAPPKNGKTTTTSKSKRKPIAKKVTKSEPGDSASDSGFANNSVPGMEELDDSANVPSAQTGRPSMARAAIALVSKLVGVSPSKK